MSTIPAAKPTTSAMLQTSGESPPNRFAATTPAITKTPRVEVPTHYLEPERHSAEQRRRRADRHGLHRELAAVPLRR